MLAGMEAAHPDYIRLLPELNVVVRTDAPPGTGGIGYGGRSRADPWQFVGKDAIGGLCRRCLYFANTDQILAAIKEVDGGAGVLLVIKNYTGDVMNLRWQPSWQQPRT